MPSTPSAALLCLACSASLPPHKVDSKVYLTQCCARPICPHCLSTNPRLARYNPCLRCLAGVNAVKTRTSVTSSSQRQDDNATTRVNIDGSVRDEDIFVVEDEDEDESDTDSSTDEGQRSVAEASSIGAETAQYGGERTPSVSPSGQGVAEAASSRETEEGFDPHSDAVAQQTATTSGMPPKYYIRPDDTLIGISLKLKVDARLLCRLNNLPASTLRTTPHLLHTRSFLTLPPSAPAPPPLSPAELAADDERQARFARERAETRFQAMTKETDRGVAKAYVALAGLPDEEAGEIKQYEKENGLRKRRVTSSEDDGAGGHLEGRAMERYFDDEEWEASERAEGRKAALPSFPYAAAGESSRAAGKVSAEKSWWRWKN